MCDASTPGLLAVRSARETGAAFVLIALIGFIALLDYASGVEVVVFVLYFLPIIAAGWLLRPRNALLVATIAAIAWIAGVLTWRGARELPYVRAWNAFAVVGSLAAVTGLVRYARRSHDALLAINGSLDLALTHESETARTDALTGLPNARALHEALGRELARSHRSGLPLALLYVDLDNFKEVNDRHGHAEGDRILRIISAGLLTTLRAGDIAARIGGDEFVILLTAATPEAAKHVAARIVRMASDSASKNYPGTTLGASVGVAHFSSRFPATAVEALSRADAAMYQAKHDGKGRVFGDMNTGVSAVRH